jgi:hypothetical protein
MSSDWLRRQDRTLHTAKTEDLRTHMGQDGLSWHRAPSRRSRGATVPPWPEDHEKPEARLHMNMRPTIGRKPPFYVAKASSSPRDPAEPVKHHAAAAKGRGHRRVERPPRHRIHRGYARRDPLQRCGRGRWEGRSSGGASCSPAGSPDLGA